MKMLTIKKDGIVLTDSIEDASSFFRRFMGLMYRKSMPQHYGLLLTPCNEIHTFGMRFSIDTVTLSKENEVLFVDREVRPNKIRPRVSGGHKVLELNAGCADEFGIQVGDILDFM